MTEALAEPLVRSCEQVLETMFFTGVASAERCAPAQYRGGVCITVTFSGPPDGTLCVAISRETAAALASSFLGRPAEEIGEPDCVQVAGELANMFCGSMLSRYSPSSELRLFTHASLSPEAPALSSSPSPDTCVCLELPEGSVQVSVHMDRP